MKKTLHFLRLLLLSAFFLLLQPSSLWATDILFKSNGDTVTWKGDASKVKGSNIICTKMSGGVRGWEYLYDPNHESLHIIHGTGSISIQTAFLQKNVSSITFRVAKTIETYAEGNRIHIQSYASEYPVVAIGNSDWVECTSVTELSVDKVINETKVNEWDRKAYSPEQYDEVTYDFSPSFTGYIRLYVYQAPISWADSYLIIPEITVTFAEPSAPSPCPNCFLVTF